MFRLDYETPPEWVERVEGDLLARQFFGIAGAVEALVVAPDPSESVGEKRKRSHHLTADLGMPVNYLQLFIGQLRG